MNQILISETLYVTPEIRRKKIIYKINFFIALFLMIILFFYYIYAEYDRYLDEQKSEQVLSSLKFTIEEGGDGNIKFSDDKIRVVLNETKILEGQTDFTQYERTPEELERIRAAIEATTRTAPNGETYHTVGEISIPKIGVNYAILDHNSDELLKISPTKFHGPDPNMIGNLCVVGHNYRTNQFFSKVPTLENGDIVEIKDLLGNIVQYEVYDKYIVDETDTSSTAQNTNGTREVTLITCTNDSIKRVIVKAKEI